MKKAVVLVVLLCAVAIAASGDKLDTAKLQSFLLGGANPDDSEVKAMFIKLTAKVMQCMKAKQPVSEATMIECTNNNKDNSACCKKAGLTDEKCVKQFCDGMPPVKLTVTGPEVEACLKGANKAIGKGVAQCWLDSFN